MAMSLVSWLVGWLHGDVIDKVVGRLATWRRPW